MGRWDVPCEPREHVVYKKLLKKYLKRKKKENKGSIYITYLKSDQKTLPPWHRSGRYHNLKIAHRRKKAARQPRAEYRWG